jgi:UDP-glucose 4-epimerase
MTDVKKILVIGNGYIADNLIFHIKEQFNCTVYARNKHVEHDNVTYIYDSIENIDNIQNDFDNIFILFGHSRPNNTTPLNEVLYSNVFLVSKILDFATKNMSKIFYPATSLALSNTTNKLNYYAYSHTIVVDLIKNFKLPYTICYLHNIYGSLTNSIKKNKMVIDIFIDRYHDKQNIQLINNGKQRRIFTHISDVVKYMVCSLNESNKEVNLIKCNSMYSIKEIADLLELESITIENTLYSTEDPNINAIDVIDNWYETIDITKWILSEVKI